MCGPLSTSPFVPDIRHTQRSVVEHVHFSEDFQVVRQCGRAQRGVLLGGAWTTLTVTVHDAVTVSDPGRGSRGVVGRGVIKGLLELSVHIVSEILNELGNHRVTNSLCTALIVIRSRGGLEGVVGLGSALSRDSISGSLDRISEFLGSYLAHVSGCGGLDRIGDRENIALAHLFEGSHLIISGWRVDVTQIAGSVLGGLGWAEDLLFMALICVRGLAQRPIEQSSVHRCQQLLHFWVVVTVLKLGIRLKHLGAELLDVGLEGLTGFLHHVEIHNGFLYGILERRENTSSLFSVGLGLPEFLKHFEAMRAYDLDMLKALFQLIFDPALKVREKIRDSALELGLNVFDLVKPFGQRHGGNCVFTRRGRTQERRREMAKREG